MKRGFIMGFIIWVLASIAWLVHPVGVHHTATHPTTTTTVVATTTTLPPPTTTTTVPDVALYNGQPCTQCTVGNDQPGGTGSYNGQPQTTVDNPVCAQEPNGNVTQTGQWEATTAGWKIVDQTVCDQAADDAVTANG